MIAHNICRQLINPNSLDNKGSWRILKDFYRSVTMLREFGLTVIVFILLICLCVFEK